MASVAKAGRAARLQPRDLRILRALYESRVMTAEHIAALCFNGSYEAARKRLQKLKAAGYVGERPRRAYDPAVCFLTKKAFNGLIGEGAIADLPQMSWVSLEKRVRVSELTLRHELEIQDVRAAMYAAAAKVDGLSIEHFLTWPVLYSFNAFDPQGQRVTVRPDGFIRFHQQTGDERFAHFFFLELDRSTEPQETLISRAHCYRDFYQRGGLAAWHGKPASDFARFPFRVLIICKNAKRRNNSAQRLLLSHPPIIGQVWLSTFQEILDDPFGPVWLRPGDLRDALERSDAPIEHATAGRELFIETKSPMKTLL